MNKLTSLALLGLLQIALAMNLPCADKNDMTKCRVAMAEMIDMGIQNAEITMIKNLMHRYIDMIRDTKCDKDDDCKNIVEGVISEAKNDLKAIDDKSDNEKELKVSVERLKMHMKQNDFRKKLGHEMLQKLAKEHNIEKVVEELMQMFIDEVMWHLKEASNELKEHDVKIDEIEESLQKLKTINEMSSDEFYMKFDKFLQELVELGKAMNMSWAKSLKVEIVQ